MVDIHLELKALLVDEFNGFRNGVCRCRWCQPIPKICAVSSPTKRVVVALASL